MNLTLLFPPRFQSLLLVGIVLIAPGCGWFDSEKPAKNHTLAGTAEISAPQQKAAVRSEESSQYIEIIWEVPSEPVDQYLIRYGTEADALNGEVRLKPEAIQKIRHEHYGEVYRYLLPNLPRDSTVYVSIAAVSADGQSAPSKIFEVAPETPTPTPTSAALETPATEESPSH